MKQYGSKCHRIGIVKLGENGTNFIKHLHGLKNLLAIDISHTVKIHLSRGKSENLKENKTTEHIFSSNVPIESVTLEIGIP